MSRSGGTTPVGVIQAFVPALFYPAKSCIIQSGILYQRNADGISGASFAADVANWTALGSSTLLGKFTSTSNMPASPFINTTGLTPVSGLSVTVAVGARPVYVEFDADCQAATASQTFGNISIREDGTEILNRQVEMPASGQFGGEPLHMGIDSSPAPGSHTYTVAASTNNAANTWLFAASATSKTTLRVTQT